MLLAMYHPLPDGVGTIGVFTEGPQVLYVLPYLGLSAHTLPSFAIVCNMLSHFVHISPWKFIWGNIYIYIYICNTCVYYTYVYIYIYIYNILCICVYIYIYTYTYICITYIYIYIYVYTYVPCGTWSATAASLPLESPVDFLRGIV